MNTIYGQIYKKLIRLIPNLEKMEVASHQISKIGGSMMDLHLEVLSEKIEKRQQIKIISLAHYYEQNGDLIPDPDMTVRVYSQSKMAEALTFQNCFIYQEIYPTPTTFYPKLKTQLNSFLNSWLSTCIRQGHGFNNNKTNLED